MSVATHIRAAVWLSVGLASACLNPDTPTIDQRVDSLFAERVAPGAPGCAVGVSRGDTVLYTHGYGIANLDYDIPVTPDTVFDVGSVTKQFTAASIVLLSLDGTLSLDDDVRVHLPELPDYGDPITIRHLLHHTSGIRDYLNLMALAGREFYAPISHQDIVELMARQHRLNSMPGERYRYSNTGYMLLATIVDRVAGRTYGEYAHERIFEPLGMTRSFLYENPERIVTGRATRAGWPTAWPTSTSRTVWARRRRPPPGDSAAAVRRSRPHRSSRWTRLTWLTWSGSTTTSATSTATSWT